MIVTLGEFVVKRQQAWQHKTYGTHLDEQTQEMFSKYRYTNIWRELDRHSIYLFNSLQRNKNNSLEEDIISTIRFRAFNRIDTSEYLLDVAGSYDAAFETTDKIYGLLKDRKPNFTAAHARCFGLMKTCDAYSGDKLVEPAKVIATQIKSGDQCAAWKSIIQVTGIAEFMANMVTMDVTWLGSRYHGGEDVIFFPRFKRGAEAGFAYCQETNQGNMTTLIARCHDALDEIQLPTIDGKRIGFGMRELEHALCEYSKYVRVMSTTSVRYNDVHLRRYFPGSYDDAKVDPLPKTWKM